jgi:hypothetical protein
MTIYHYNLDDIKKLISQGHVDIPYPKVVYVSLTQQIRTALIKDVAKENGLEYENLTHAAVEANIRKEGEFVPIILLEVADPNNKQRRKYIFSCGEILKECKDITPYAWTHLVADIKKDSATLYQYTNTVIDELPFKIGPFDNEKIKLVKSIIEDPNDTTFYVGKAELDIPAKVEKDPTEDTSSQEQSTDTEEKTAESGTEDSAEQNDTVPPQEHRINSMSSNHKFRLPKFKENDNCDAWVKKSNFILTLGGVSTDAKKISNMSSHLPDAIQDTVILELAELDESKYTISEFKKVLNRACKKNDIQYGVLLRKLKYNPDTHLNLRNFYYRINQLVKQTIGGDSTPMLEKISFKEFLEKLPHKVQTSEMLLEYRKDNTKSIMDLVDKCSELYDNYKLGSHSDINHITKIKGFKKNKGSLNNIAKKQVTCYYCNKPGHIKPECRKLKADQSKNGGMSKSFSKPGFKSTGYRSNAPTKTYPKKSFGNNWKPKDRNDNCRYCTKPGHYEKDCFKKKRDQNGRRESNFKRRQ